MSELLIVVPDAESEQEVEFLRENLAQYRTANISSHVYMGVPTTTAEWADRVAEADALVLGWHIPDEVLVNAARLKVISFLGTGASDHINLKLAEKHNIEVLTVSGYADHAVAEHTFALLLGLARNVIRHDADIKAGRWNPQIGSQLYGRTIGLVGYGGIGKSVARIAQGFGMRVLAWSRSGVVDDHATGVSLEYLLRESDFVSLHLALTPETKNFLSHDQFKLMKSTAYLINTARGELIDEAALLDALDSNIIAGAGLDVFAKEPIPAEDHLSRHKDVLGTPHVGFATKEADAELLRRGVASVVERLKKR